MKRLMVLVAIMAMSGVVGAYEFRPLGVAEMAQWGATHVLDVDYSDLKKIEDATTNNTPATITVAVPAKTAVELRAMILDEAFDTAETNYTGSCLLQVGDGSDVDLHLTSTELASEGTEVFVKFAPLAAATAVSTVTPMTKSVYVAADGEGTNFVAQAVCTNATVATTVSVAELGRKASTSAQNVVLTFTPNADEALADNVQGKVRLFFRLTEWKKK